MNPTLEFAQAIDGRTTGQGTGIIDTVHLFEVARAFGNAGEISRCTGNSELLSYCRDRFTSVLVPNQIAPNGSFPSELARTKPYGYCLFNLDAMGTLFEILASVSDTVWTFEIPDGRGIRKAVEYMFPSIADKLLPADVQYFAEWPVRQPSLLFVGLAFSRPAHVKLWLRLNPQPVTEEIIRNFPSGSRTMGAEGQAARPPSELR